MKYGTLSLKDEEILPRHEDGWFFILEAEIRIWVTLDSDNCIEEIEKEVTHFDYQRFISGDDTPLLHGHIEEIEQDIHNNIVSGKWNELIEWEA